MTSKILTGLLAGLAAVIWLVAPAEAATDAGDTATYLNELQRIAGQPVPYELGESDSATSGVHTMALDPYVCVLYPSQVHLRKSGGWGTVGAKPYTECSAGTPTSITQTSTLYIVEWAGLAYKTMQIRTVNNVGERKLEQRNVSWACLNGNNSVFQQKTNGTTVQAGKTYYSTVQTVRSTLSCGY
ncbi:hypothetical protein [Microbacterium sp. 69-10]|uniref:hypothetical protein n=1 Tax=Microbacterium sp. 69-10 TaxID=1895783 RepID=UPI0025F05886|nr:hypothetical protein [Microbacterium sp. 69-10]